MRRSRPFQDVPDQIEIELAPGAEGNFQTLEVMRQVARLRSTAPLVRTTAVSVVNPVAQNDNVGEVTAIASWVRSSMKYRFDPADQEQLTDPLTLLDQIARGVPTYSSDCDDMSLLTATLLLSLGYGDIYFCAVRYDPNANEQDSFDHVYTVAYVKDKDTGKTVRIPLDCILSAPIGSEVTSASKVEYAI